MNDRHDVKLGIVDLSSYGFTQFVLRSGRRAILKIPLSLRTKAFVLISIEKIAQVTGHKGSIFSLYPQDDDHFLSAGGEGWIVSWNTTDPDPGKLIARVESNVFSMYAFGDTIIAGDMNGGMHWIDLETNDTVDLQHHRKGVFDIWEADGHIYGLGGDGYISRRPIDDPHAVESVQISHQALRCQTSIDGQRVAVGSSDGNVYIVDLHELSVTHKIENVHTNSVFTIVYDESRGRLISGGRDAQIKVYSIDGTSIDAVAAHMYTVNKLCLDHSRQLLFSGSRDKTIKVWDADTMRLLKVVEGIRDGGHLNSVNSLLWCPNQHCLISGSDDKSIGIWKIENTANDII